MNKTLVLALMSALFLAGCATGNKSLYDWGQYEQTLFVVYHEPEYKDQALENYLAFVRQYEGQSRLAPGLYAEAGTFLLEQGDVNGAIGFYKMEYERWPESRPMLGILIENLEGQL